MSRNLPISEQVAQAKTLEVGGWTLAHWPDGTFFLESPYGEGTQLQQKRLEEALLKLFREHF